MRSHLCMANGEHRTSDTFETQIEIRGLNETASFTLKGVQVVDRLSDLRSSIPSASDFENYPHLSDVDIPLIDRTVVNLLIGLNYRILHELTERRDAGEEKLCAGRTVLGWFLYGNDCYSQSSPEENVVCHIVGLDDRSDADLLKLAVISPANKGQCPTGNGTGGPHQTLSLIIEPLQLMMIEPRLSWTVVVTWLMDITRLPCPGFRTILGSLTIDQLPCHD